MILLIIVIVLALCLLLARVGGDNYKEDYHKDLESDQWKVKREKILSRDGYKCQWCGSKTNLQVHHKYYNKYPNGERVRAWDYPDSALITLCRSCHKRYHQVYQVNSYYRKYGKHFE